MTQRRDDREPEEWPEDPDGDDPTALVPPHDLDAEAAVLAAVMMDARRLAEVEWLEPAHFYSGRHREIYTAVRALHDAGATIDALTVASRLKEARTLAQVGGIPYITSILDSVPVVANLRAYAVTVHDRWRLRQVILATQSIAARGYGEAVTNVQGFADEAVRTVATIARDSPTSAAEPQWMVLRRLVAQMSEAARLTPNGGRTPGLPTGLRSLDLKTLGLQPGKKVTVMAMRGRGKTSFGLQVAMHAAGWRGRHEPLASRRVAVRFYELEMTKEELGVKQLAFAARVDSLRIERQLAEPTLSPDEWQRISEAMPLLERMSISIDDRGDMTGDDVVADLRQAAAQSQVVDGVPLGLAIVDYVQRLKMPAGGKNRREDELIGDNSKALKDGAKELQLPILELAQMNAPDPKVSKIGRPYEGLASQCKRIEKEADIVLCLWRKRRDNFNDYGLTCTKLRGGEEFDLDLEFEPEFSTFVDPAYKGFRSAFEDFR